MDNQKKKSLSAKDIEEQLNKLIQSAVDSLTQFIPEDMNGCFCRRVIQLKPAQVTQHSYQSVYSIIRTKMPLANNCMIKICDEFITTYPNEVFLKFMEFATLRSLAVYQSEQYDCDDFSMTFASLARKWHARLRVGLTAQTTVKKMIPEAPLAIVPPATCTIAHIPAASTSGDDQIKVGGAPIGMCHGKLSANSEEHAFNFWINEKGDIIYIEPQLGVYINLGEGAKIDFVYL